VAAISPSVTIKLGIVIIIIIIITTPVVLGINPPFRPRT
jgi:hypothetical protein